ncbi:MAG: hypothetical protein AAFQ51_16760 [Pseudomonadota bacterium]
MEKIRLAATALIPVLVVFAVLYITFTAGEDIAFAFLDRARWYDSYWVHPDSPGPNWQRALYLAIWLAPVALGLFAVFHALRLVMLIRRGVLFDDRIGRLLRLVGIGTGGSGLADFVANLITPQVMSLTNPEGPVPFSWYFDSEPAGLVVCGGGFYLIGWIIVEARRIADENREFI